MEKRAISIEAAFKFAWQRFQTNAGIWIVLAIPTVLFEMVHGLISKSNPFHPSIGIPLVILCLIILLAQVIGTYWGLRALNQENVPLGMLDDVWRFVPASIVGYLVMMALLISAFAPIWGSIFLIPQLEPAMVNWVVLGGILLCFIVLPVVLYFCVKLWLFNYLILDKDLGAFASMAESARVTKGYRGTLFLYFIIGAILNIPSRFTMGLSQFITYPLITLAGVNLYRQIVPRGE